MLFAVLLAACDTSPATPTPAPTATTAAAATATTPANSQSATQTPAGISGGQATVTTVTSAGKGKLSTAKQGTLKPANPQSPKGDIAKKTIAAAKGKNLLTSIQPARATATRPSSRPTATEVPSASPLYPEDWSVVVDSDFTTGDPGTWLTGDAGDLAADVADGAYNMTVKNGTGFYTWSDETSDWTDGYISATLTIKGNGYGGLVARLDKENDADTNVVCMISNGGRYGCYTEANGEIGVINEATSSDIKRNGENTIGLLAVGSDFVFYINGEATESFSNEDVTEGAWGAYVETPEDTTTVAQFSHILFMGPAGEEPTAEPTEEATIEPTEEATTEPTEEATAEATEEATTEPTEEATTEPGETPTVSGNVILETDFSQDPGTWYTGQGDGYSVDIVDGQLVVEYDTPQGLVTTSADEAQDLKDARFEATLTIKDESRSNPGYVGIFARGQQFDTDFQDWSQIFCGINNNSAYTCDLLSNADDGSINFTELIHGKTSAIKGNKENKIALIGKGSRWTFEINGTKVGSFTDNTVKSGAWGILVNSGDATTTGMISKIGIYKP